MPIHVICQTCKTGFQVNEKFAGKKGPCPKCKTVIQVPEKAEEIVIHAPEAGAKDAKGRTLVKPILRQETRFSKKLAIVVGVSAVVLLGISVYLRTYDGKIPPVMLIVGAIALGPPLAWCGYGFLRNDEFEPFRGKELWIRALICGLVYAALWGIYAYVVPYALDLGTKKADIYQMLFIVPPLLAIGGAACLTSLELDFLSSLLHCGFYLLVTLALSYIAGVPVF